MQGYNALWMPGTDHAGIATQAVVERRLLRGEERLASRPGPRGAGRAHLGLEERIRSAHPGPARSSWAAAATGGGPASRSTTVCARAVRHTFFSLFKEGLIYRGTRLVNWDTLSANGRQRRRGVSRNGGGALLALAVSGASIRSRASRRTSPSPPRGPRRCWATRPWPCIPIRQRHSTRPRPSCGEKLAEARKRNGRDRRRSSTRWPSGGGRCCRCCQAARHGPGRPQADAAAR